jgi:hypothetical protein
VIDKHMEMVRSLGYPAHSGMVATGVIVRSGGSADVKKLCNAWWKMVQAGSKRDQLSFNCASWAEGVPYKAVEFDDVIGPMIEKVNHQRKVKSVAASIAVRAVEQKAPVAKFDLSKGDPLVTVVIPTRNRPELLSHAIGMVRMQTWTKVEVLVVDDSDPEFRTHRSAAPDVNHVVLEERVSVGLKHDMAMLAAKGDVIAHWDDDDWFAPNRLESQIRAMREQGAEICGIMRDLVLMDGKWWRIVGGEPGWEGNADLKAAYTFHDGTAMFLRGAVPKGASYGDRQVCQKVKLLNEMIAGGVRWTSIENSGKFVYVRHGSNSWKFNEASAMVSAPRPPWFPDYEALFYSSIGRVHAGQADPVR